ncbi:hypothetical protein LIN78_10100 [Leeia sp. TBRC 13508]|uniref:Uncharacterized protein n=1 Tax=Leeia speluncae TaxID=2884804 RepID=A0ABS8D6R4_9NEIS|nr:hypothetical protein [Leeia speluncae]MCB6183895.1 hypothetical protein [Leeia speluncae]
MLAVFTRFIILLAGLFGFVVIYSHLFKPEWKVKIRAQVNRIAWAFVLLSVVYILTHLHLTSL